jgi:hypothetical protein
MGGKWGGVEEAIYQFMQTIAFENSHIVVVAVESSDCVTLAAPDGSNKAAIPSKVLLPFVTMSGSFVSVFLLIVTPLGGQVEANTSISDIL